MTLSLWMLENNVTVTEMAASIETNRTNLSAIRNGHRKPTKDILDKIEIYTKNEVSREQLLKDFEQTELAHEIPTVHTALRDLSKSTRKLMAISRGLKKTEVQSVIRMIAKILEKYDKRQKST